MKNKVLITSLLIISHLFANAQQGNRLFSGEIENIAFLKYPENTKIKATLTSQKEALCNNPEALLRSIMSCTNAGWEAYHTQGGEENADIKPEEHYHFIKTMNRDNNYFEIQHKFEFEVMNVPTAIIKFYLVTDQFPKPMAGVEMMQNIEGRWQKTSMKMFSKMAMLALRLNSDKLKKIIDGSQEDKFLKAIHSKIFDGNTLNFDKLSAEIDSWYAEDSKYNQDMKTYFKDPNSLF